MDAYSICCKPDTAPMLSKLRPSRLCSPAKLLGVTSIISDLERLVPRGVKSAKLETRLYSQQYSRLANSASIATLLPTTEEELITVMRYAAGAGISVSARGAHTGRVPEKSLHDVGLQICLTRLRCIHDVDVRKACAQVDAGVTNTSVRQAAEKVGLTYLPDPTSERSSTIGGNIALNASGPGAWTHGRTGDFVQEMSLVLWSGELVRSQDFADGRALVQLVTGAQGKIGIVSRASLILSPGPSQTLLLVARFCDYNAGLAFSQQVMKLNLPLTSTELYDETLTNLSPDLQIEGAKVSSIAIRLDGNRRDIQTALPQLRDALHAYGASDVSCQYGPAAERAAHRLAHRVFGLMTDKPHYRCVDLAAPRSALGAAVQRAKAKVQSIGFQAAIRCRPTDGVFHVFIWADDISACAPNAVDRLVDRLRHDTAALGGAASSEFGLASHSQDAGYITARAVAAELVQAQSVTALPMKSRVQDASSAQVFKPETDREVAEIIRSARSHSMQLFVMGSATRSASYRALASKIDTSKFRGLIRFDPEDGTVTLRAGTQVARVQEDLSSHNHRIAGLGLETGTVGGALSTGAFGRSGMRTHGRSALLGGRFVNGRGDLIRFGGPTLKSALGFNPAGPLICGWGDFGILTEVTLKTEPIPPVRKILRIQDLAPEKIGVLHITAMQLIAVVDVWWKTPSQSTIDLSIEGHSGAVAEALEKLAPFGPVEVEAVDVKADTFSPSLAGETGQVLLLRIKSHYDPAKIFVRGAPINKDRTHPCM